MTATHAYWARKADCPRTGNLDAIGGWCGINDVPSYGEIGHLALPTDIEVTLDEAGGMTIVSPPIIGTSRSYRYRVSLSAQSVAEIATMSDYRIESALGVVVGDSPNKGTDLTNWWWHHHDRFHYSSKYITAPVRLMTRWKRAMLVALLATHPRADEVVRAWDVRVSNHKAHNAHKRTTRTTNHRKAHGDLVVLPYPVRFASETCHQVFRYHVQASSYSRAKHSLRIRGTVYTTPHSEAVTFHDGTAPIDALSPAIQLSLALLAWNQAPADTAHTLLATQHKFTALVAQRQAALAAWLAGPAPHDHPTTATLHLEAALNALRSFFNPDQTITTPYEQQRYDKVALAVQQAKTCISEALIQHTPATT